ncbi:protein LAZY 1-like [Rutidosis leptorrhynchoides]|uniref:protein LAZY 1-like n=1 Tax=Rutidosis leptorrhynchoides TaxID=125765 RepID=UPI003A9A4246
MNLSSTTRKFKMKTLAWMQRAFQQNCDEITRDSSTSKPYSCFSALRKLEVQPKVCPESSISLHGVKQLKEEETVETNPELFYGFLAIGTLGSISTIYEETLTPKDATVDDIANAKENSAAQNKTKKLLIEKEEPEVTEQNKINVEYSLKANSELPKIKEEAKEQKTMSSIDFMNDAKCPVSSYKKSRKLNGIKAGNRAQVLPFMKKMLKKTLLASCCSPSSGGVDATFLNSTEKISSKIFKKSRKIHPEASDLQVHKSHVKKVCEEDYDREVTFEEEDEKTFSNSMFANRPVNSQPKAHWINSDPDYFVLEF